MAHTARWSPPVRVNGRDALLLRVVLTLEKYDPQNEQDEACFNGHMPRRLIVDMEPPAVQPTRRRGERCQRHGSQHSQRRHIKTYSMYIRGSDTSHSLATATFSIVLAVHGCDEGCPREAHTHSVQRRDTRVKQPPLDGRNQIDAHRRLMIVVISQESLPNVMIGRPQQYLLPQLDVQSAAQLCMLCRALWPP